MDRSDRRRPGHVATGEPRSRPHGAHRLSVVVVVGVICLLAVAGCGTERTLADARAGAEDVLASYGTDLLPQGVTPGPPEAEVRQGCTTQQLVRIRVPLEAAGTVDPVAALASVWQDHGEVTRSGGDAYLERDGYTVIAIADAGGDGPMLQVESPCVDEG